MSALESCRWVRTQLPRFLDGELAPDLETRVSGHLDRCAACRAELAVERDLLLDTLELLSPTRPPQGMVDAVLARIAE
ncbi:MAG: anti-sigma factor family protein, partial [Planctomycetota bacterium]